MTRHLCPGDDCRHCEARIDRIEYERATDDDSRDE